MLKHINTMKNASQVLEETLHGVLMNQFRESRKILANIKLLGRELEEPWFIGSPMAFFYTLNKNHIVVLAVAHARRNPKHWQSRS